MDTDAVKKLPDMQRACLRLVAELQKTEQIAYSLGIAPSTVNTHIERAIARLGVANRREAARLVVAHDAATTTKSDDPHLRLTEPPSVCPEKSPTEALPLAGDAPTPSQSDPSAIAMGRRRNDLTVPQRLMLAVLALALLCIGIAGLGAAVEQLSQWRAAHGARR